MKQKLGRHCHTLRQRWFDPQRYSIFINKIFGLFIIFILIFDRSTDFLFFNWFFFVLVDLILSWGLFIFVSDFLTEAVHVVQGETHGLNSSQPLLRLPIMPANAEPLVVSFFFLFLFRSGEIAWLFTLKHEPSSFHEKLDGAIQTDFSTRSCD